MILPEKQARAIAMLAEGMRDDQIAQTMMTTTGAIRATIHRAVKNLGAKTRCHAVAITVKRQMGR